MLILSVQLSLQSALKLKTEFFRYSMLGCVEDPSEFETDGNTILTNTRRDPTNFTGTDKATRFEI